MYFQINKGIMHANVSGGNIKTIAPRTSNVVGVSSYCLIVGINAP